MGRCFVCKRSPAWTTLPISYKHAGHGPNQVCVEIGKVSVVGCPYRTAEFCVGMLIKSSGVQL